MLKFLSAFNLMAGTLYFLCYLSGGGIYAISGNLAVLIFNGAALYGLEKGRHKWNLIQYLSAPASMLFVLFLFYSSWYLARSAIETSFATRALWLLLIFSVAFGLLIFFQLLLTIRLAFRGASGK
ncbi:hypothetical protein [Pedobacter nutrimenti]|jgi:Na+-transporting NADH:ubiquinone oxidoreductase subunit NqrB|uniref:Uncharacterized protein n=1 Tax=Pedobacter nutrimenti TaxID=1241337 RepID=A0A318UKJ3_9SPHI|nr:hypothetical protein [Pedobacter nutrimenti]PYF75897.1 hypothetical protein B0O44_102452 [Pedobacter nutrimenti]